MNRPGGNVTGITPFTSVLGAKAIIGDIGYARSVLEMAEVQVAARKVGVDTEVLEIRSVADIAPAFQALKSGAQALHVCPGARW